MKSLITFLLLFFIQTVSVLTQTIPVNLFVENTKEEETLCTVTYDEYCYGWCGSMCITDIIFDSINWSSETNEIFLSGNTLDFETKESLPYVFVSIGGLDTLNESFRLKSNFSTVTDSLGAFKLKGKVNPGNKLLFTGIGFTAKLFHLDWLFTRFK
ncbi:MAG: hypothetical protein IPM56_18325 [Ignavibacteriales bacterium]|nr:MAG: hypothetical protein IPM56_18325 [Ignavibacteriales bacterium]